MEMHAFILSILLLTLLSGSEARSVDQVCSEKCTNGIRQFFVKDDYEYSYTYLTTVESSFHTGSAQDQKAQLSIQVPFSIITSSDCNLVLQVNKGIYIDSRTPQTEEELAWQETITAYPLHFSWQNGVVENVCPSTDEPTWVSNFKKGILSAIQVTTTSTRSAVKELDISGDCEADYFVESEATMVIRKTKDYTKCKNRNKHLLFSWSLPYDLSSPRQNYIYSQQSCQHVVADVLQSVECTEEHVFRPFSTDQAGARTNIRQRVTFQGQSRLRSNPYARVIIRRSDLAFEDELELRNSNMEERTRAAKDLLTEICATMDGENYQNVGKEFISLVHTIRELNTESLTELNSHADTCIEWNSALKQMLANTLPFCGTKSCVSLATSLMMDNTLDKRVAERWLAGFGLINKPSEEMISSLLDVVESGRYPEQSFLATGSMIHQFCQNSEENCMNNRVIRSSVEVLMQHLGTNCRSPNSESRKMTLLALRTIGNAGQTTSSTTLKRCIEETDNPMEIRVAAANAYRRMSCGTDKSTLLGVLQNPDEDSELRITSYINLMQCPTADLVTIVKNMLETEQSMQVGSFIWSHLTQVMESQDPLKHFFQVLLQGHTFKDFNLDPRKYSKYYESSLFSEKLNSGGTAEANLIWSPKSFIPRAASVNFTLDLFGQAVNLFEFGGRVEGAENLLQSILEPDAYKKRNARSDLQPFGSERRRTTEIKKTADKAQASWFMRVFGNELIYGNTDMMEPIEAESSSLFSDMMAKFMTDDGYTYHDDALILNSIHTLPTGNGLPLQIAFNGSTTVDVNAAGRFNMGFGANAEYLVRGKVTPRAALVVTGSMTVDAHIRKTGIAAESIAYSSTSLSGYVKISDGGRSFDFEIDSQYNRNMAFNFNHKLLKIEGESVSDMGGTMPSLTLNENTDCTDEFIGQRFCFNKLYHDAGLFNDETSSYIFPTNGEVTLSAYMEKADLGLTKYTFSGQTRTEYENEEDMIPQNMLLRLNFDTPGSHVNRKTTTFFSYSIPEKQINIRAQQGEATLLQLQGECLSGDGSNGVRISAEYKEEMYRFEANTRRILEDNRKQMATDVTIVLPSKTMTINAMMDFHAGKRFQGTFEMNDVLPTPVVMRIDLQDNSESEDILSFSGNGKMTVLPFINSEFIVDMDLTPKLDNMVFNLNYKIGGSPKQSVLFHHKRTNLGRGGETDWTISQMFTAQQFTALNHKISISHKYSKGSTTSNLAVGYGPRMEEPDNEYKLGLRQEYSDTSDSTTTRLNGQWAVNFPYGGVDREIRFSHERDANILSTNIDSIVSGNPYHFTFLWKNNVPGSPLRNENLEVSLYPTPYGDWKFINTLQEVVENVYDVRSTISLGNLEELQFIQKTTITNKADNKSIEFFLTKGGDESEIMRASSVNYAVGDSRKVSKNLIHVIGYDQRGLDFTHETLPTKGCRTSVNFIKGSTATVGLDFTYKPTESGKHYLLAARQYEVSERVILAKFGYDHIPNRLYDTYITLTDDDATRFSFRTTTRRSADKVWSGNFLFAAKGHPSSPFSQKIDSNMTVSYTIGDTVEIDFSHRCRDKNLHITAVTSDNGIHGILQHNYCDYFNDASYNVAHVSNGVNAMISSGGRQAHATALVTKNIVKMTWDHESMPDLLEFNVPTEVSVTLEKNRENTPKNLHSTITVDGQTVFDMTYSCNRPEEARNQFTMSNSVFTMLPSSANWDITNTGEQLDITVGLNSENMRITMINNFPDSGSFVIAHSFELLEMAYIPNDFKLSYDGQFQPGLTHFNVVLGEKVITFDANVYSNSHIKVDLVTQGISTLPTKAKIELQGEFSSPNVVMTGTGQYNENTYGLSVKGSSDYQTGSTFIPYVETIGTSEYLMKITKDDEVKCTIDVHFTTSEDQMNHRYELHQTLTEYYPASIVEEQNVVVRDNEFSLLRTKTENGVKVSHYELRYESGKISFTQTYTPIIPESTVVTYNFEMERGQITLTSEMEGTKTASLAYTLIDQNGYTIQAEHNFDDISAVVPRQIGSTGSWTPDGNSVKATYQWGTKAGSMRFWKNSLRNMGLETNSNHCSFNFTYHLRDNGIEVSSQVRCGDHTYGTKFDGGFQLDAESLMVLKNVHGDLDVHADEKYFFSKNFYEIRGKSFFVNMTMGQTFTDKLPASCNFTRTFTFGMTSNSIDLQIDGTKQDPFYLKVILSHNELNSATAEMHHTQSSWTDVPKTFIAKLERSKQGQNYKTMVTVTMDEEITAAVATLAYTSDETSGSVDAKFTNEFTNIPYLPQIASLSARGSMENSVITWKLTGTCDDKVYNETGNVNYAEAPTQFSFQFLQNQNILAIYPKKSSVSMTKTPKAIELIITYNDKKLTFRFDLTDIGVTIAASEMTGSEITPYNMGLTWMKEPMKVELTHDIDQLSPIPRIIAIQTDMDNENLHVTIGANSEISVRKVTDDNTVQLLIEHNIDILSPIPTNTQLTYQKSPKKVTLVWEENEVSVETSALGFVFKQNAVETIPKIVTFNTDFDFMKMIEVNAVIDDYTMYYKMTLQSEEAYAMTLLWTMSKGDESLLNLDIASEVSGTQGSEKVTFTQSLSENILPSYSHSVEYNLGQTAGMISFETGIEDPIRVKVTYSDVQAMGLRYGLVHNLESIVEIFPYQTTGEASVEWTETTKTFRAAVLSKAISFSLVTDLSSEEKNVLATVKHDFDIIETELHIPKSAKLNVHAGSENYEALVSYTANTKESYAKFHASITASEIQFTLDQNIIEPTPNTNSRRRPQLQFPQKVSLRFVKDENTYKSLLSLKTGQKRRYFNFEYTNEESFWRLKVLQNLNRIVRMPMPNEMEVSVGVNTTTTSINVQWDDNNYDLAANLIQSENSRAGIRSVHNAPFLTEMGIPSDISMSIVKSDGEVQPYLVLAFNYGQEYAGSVTIKQPIIGAENAVTIYSKAGEIEITSTTTLAFHINGFNFELEGSQSGLDTLPSEFQFTADASYTTETRSAEFSSIHNMDLLQGLGYPKSIVATAYGPRISESSVSSGYTFNADGLKSENTIELTWTKATHGYEVSFKGVRTNNVFSTSPSDRLSYIGRMTAELDCESEEKSLKWIYEYTETDMNGETTLQHQAHILGTKAGKTVTWGIAATLPPYLEKGLTITGSLTYASDFAFNNEYRRGDYHVSVNLSGALGHNFKFGIVNKYGEMSLVFDKANAEQLTFTHNIELMSMIPNSVVVALNTNTKTASVHASFSDAEFVVNVQQYLFKTTYSTDSEGEIINILGRYTSHPTQKVLCTIKILPLKWDYSTDLEMQFFRPGDGRSFVNLSILNNRSQRGITTNIHAFLQNSNIRDINVGIYINSNLTEAPLNLIIEYIHSPLSYNFAVQVADYLTKINGTDKGCTFVLKLPRYYNVNELFIESAYSLGEGSSKSSMVIQWNRAKKIGYSTMAGWTEDGESHWSRYEIYQPFVNPQEVTAGYSYEQRNGWHIVNTTITDDGRPFIVIARYKPIERRQSKTCKINLDIRQSYMKILPPKFTTNGIVTHGESLFDSDWKITAGGEDMFTLKKHFEGTDEGYNTQIGWTHPFEDFYLSSFDGSLNWQVGPESLTITSDVTHSEVCKYFPKHFTTTGKITYNGLLYENDWKVSSNGEDFIIWYEKADRLESGVGMQITWKHPFEEYFLTQLDGTFDVEIVENTVNVHSEVTHSGKNKYIPTNFVTSGRITTGASIFDSDWKVVSEGQELVVLKEIFKTIEDGYQVTFNWKQPYEEFWLTNFDMDTVLLLQSNTMDLTVDIAHPFDHPYVPKHFVTTGVVTVGEKLYDSDWKITSGGQDIVIMKKLFQGSDNGFNMEFYWKQPYDKFVVKSINSNVVFTKEASASKFTGTVRYNDAREWSTDCSWIASNSHSRNYTIGYTEDGQRHESKFYYASQPWRSTGNTMTFVYDNIIPQESIFAKYMPTQHFDLTTFRNGMNMQFKSAYSASFIPNAVKMEGSILMSQGNTMLDSSFAFKNSPESTVQMDAEVKLNIDRENGVTVECKVPALGLDQSVNVKYDQQTQQITISYLRSGQEPIVITINLSEFVPRIKQIIEDLKQKNIIPELKIVGDINHDADSFDAFVGVRVRDTSYTIHLNSGYANQQGYMNITTKRNSAILDTILSVTAKLIKPETAEIQIQTSKKLGRFLNFALTSFSAEFKDKVVVIADAITEALQSLEGIVEGSDRIQRAIDDKRTMLLERVAQAKEISIEFIDSTNTGLLDSMTNGQEEINSGLWKAITALSVGIDKLREIVNRPLQELKQDYLTKVSTEIFNIVQPVLQPVVQVLNSFHSGQLLLELVQEGVAKLVFTLEKNAETLLSASKEPLAKLVFVSENKVVFNVPLHVPVKGLIGPPSMGDIAMWIAQSSFSHEMNAKLQILHQAVDLYYQYRSVLNMPLDELVPPFKGHAEISGFRHVRTFDGKRYDYKSGCGSKHVLARDVKDNEFTVTVNYGPRPSIEIVTLDSRGGEEIIVLKPDYSVTDENGRALIIPNEYEDVLVKRVGDILSVRTTYGLVVSCNFVSDICTVDVSPFYFARLGGMLGTFNNEPNDDYMGPVMVKVSDSEELALAWMQPGSCSGNNEEQRCIERASERCTELFEGRESTFATCFAIEDPTPYKKMCSRDSCSSNGICTAVASYARRCALRGVNLPMPSSCMNCNAVGGGTFGSTQEVEVRGADVVFVIERSGCMRFRKKEYKRFVGEIHSTLNATIASGNINYGVVGFGGPKSLAEPHTVTFGNEIFIHPTSYDMTNVEEKSILNALKRGETTQDTPTDILQALVYASQLPFRAGASRTIVLMTCSDCSGDSEVQTSYLRTLLQEQGIVVHHLRQENIQAGRTAKKVYGFNNHEVFSKNAGPNLPRSELKIPSSDQCLPLADMTGGSVWNSNYFGKDSMPLIVGEISSGVSASLNQECVCGLSEYGTTTAKCTNLLGRR